MNIATIVLAAGGSTRMGRPKVLLEHEGVPLVRRAAIAACEARLGPVSVVFGAEVEIVSTAVRDLGVSIVSNPAWAQGMGTSIHAGVASVEGDARVDAVILMLADQPLVGARILARLAHELRAVRADIAACEYGGAAGVPAIFARGLFARLRSLPAAGGAKRLLSDPGLRTVLVEFPEGLIDIDTPEDFRRFTGNT